MNEREVKEFCEAVDKFAKRSKQQKSELEKLTLKSGAVVYRIGVKARNQFSVWTYICLEKIGDMPKVYLKEQGSRAKEFLTQPIALSQFAGALA